MESQCVICKTDTFYSCVSCDLPICNRPTCSIAVDIKHPNYSEEHPKKVSECKNCQDKSNFTVPNKKKTKQQSIGKLSNCCRYTF